jgi:hypothetical protein
VVCRHDCNHSRHSVRRSAFPVALQMIGSISRHKIQISCSKSAAIESAHCHSPTCCEASPLCF